MDNEAVNKLSYGLYVLTANDKTKDNGCIINTAIQAALTPNTLSVCVTKDSFTHIMIAKSGAFNVSVISQNADFDLFKHFGFNSGKNTDKFKNFSDFSRAENGIVYITRGTNAYFSVTAAKSIDLGSHTMFIGSITDMRILSDTPSATYEYYLSKIKPKPAPQKNIQKEGLNTWRCKVCGYEYTGAELPADYICPICKHPAADFELV